MPTNYEVMTDDQILNAVETAADNSLGLVSPMLVSELARRFQARDEVIDGTIETLDEALIEHDKIDRDAVSDKLAEDIQKVLDNAALTDMHPALNEILEAYANREREVDGLAVDVDTIQGDLKSTQY